MFMLAQEPYVYHDGPRRTDTYIRIKPLDFFRCHIILEHCRKVVLRLARTGSHITRPFNDQTVFLRVSLRIHFISLSFSRIIVLEALSSLQQSCGAAFRRRMRAECHGIANTREIFMSERSKIFQSRPFQVL